MEHERFSLEMTLLICVALLAFYFYCDYKESKRSATSMAKFILGSMVSLIVNMFFWL